MPIRRFVLLLCLCFLLGCAPVYPPPVEIPPRQPDSIDILLSQPVLFSSFSAVTTENHTLRLYLPVRNRGQKNIRACALFFMLYDRNGVCLSTASSNKSTLVDFPNYPLSVGEASDSFYCDFPNLGDRISDVNSLVVVPLYVEFSDGTRWNNPQGERLAYSYAYQTPALSVSDPYRLPRTN